MKQLRIRVGLAAIVLMALLSAFTTRNTRSGEVMIWFDPHSDYLFQFYGTVTEAMDDMGAEIAGSVPMSYGYYYYRSSLPPIANPFEVIIYGNGGLGDPTYGTELRVNLDGSPVFFPNEVIFLY